VKILLLNYEFPPLGGGSSSVTREIGKRYVQRGHSVDVVTMGFGDLPKKEDVDGMMVFRVPSLRRRVEICRVHELASYIYSARRFLTNRLKHTHYDVNHTHFLLPTGLVARAMKRRFGLPYIVPGHGSDIPGYNPDRFRWTHRVTQPTLRRVGGDASRIIVMSNYLADLVRENVADYAPEHLIKIPNGIDSEEFRPGEKKNIILSTGRLLRRKGFQHLIRAVSDVDIAYEVHICGDGPMLDELRAAAARSRTKIVLHGWVENQSEYYRDLLSSAAIYVLASERENSSIALLEGMSAGCATITTNAAGCPETLGDAGVLVQPASADDLRQAILSIVANDDLRLALQQRAVERVRSVFDWDRIVDRYEKELLLAAESH
jgi:glycosyltransferase involved in cell wall biosynthesis